MQSPRLGRSRRTNNRQILNGHWFNLSYDNDFMALIKSINISFFVAIFTFFEIEKIIEKLKIIE